MHTYPLLVNKHPTTIIPQVKNTEPPTNTAHNSHIGHVQHIQHTIPTLNQSSALSLSLPLSKIPTFSTCFALQHTRKTPEIHNFAKLKTSSSPSDAADERDDLATSSKLHHHASSPRAPNLLRVCGWIYGHLGWDESVFFWSELSWLLGWRSCHRRDLECNRKGKKRGEEEVEKDGHSFLSLGKQAGRQGHPLIL